jgi:hypothetical protein
VVGGSVVDGGAKELVVVVAWLVTGVRVDVVDGGAAVGVVAPVVSSAVIPTAAAATINTTTTIIQPGWVDWILLALPR